MLGTFTSMSSPGGMGNLSYGGGSTIPQSSQFALQNTTINSSSSSGSSANDSRVHRPPFMASFSVDTLDTFVSALITHLAASKHCPINQWIPLGTDTRENMFYQFLYKELVTDESDFFNLLEDPHRFVAKSQEYLQTSRKAKGVMSDTEAVKTLLKFKFSNPTSDSQIKYVTSQWVKFLQAHRDMIDNPSGADQSGLVDTFIESNLTKVSKAQHYMFAYLRDMLPKPKTLKEAYQHLLKKLHATDAACQIGLQVGMIFPSDPTQLQHQESTKIGGSENTGAKRPRGDNDKQSQSSNQGSSAKGTKYDGACTRCGTLGHRAKQCARPDDQSQYLNDDPNTEYSDSQAWANVLKQWPGMLSATQDPRCPNKQHIFSIDGPPKISGNEKPSTKPTGGGGRGRGGRGSRGRGGGRGKGKCKCSIHSDDHCTPTDDEHLVTLVKANASLHLNFTNIYTPTVVTNTYALIDPLPRTPSQGSLRTQPHSGRPLDG